jgi:hypothetical protein
VAGHETGALRFWDLHGSVEKPVVVMEKVKGVGEITSGIVVEEESMVVTGHACGNLVEWELTRNGRGRVVDTKSHSNRVSGMARNPVAKVIGTCGLGGRVNFWRVGRNGLLMRENLQAGILVDSSGLMCIEFFLNSFFAGAESGGLYQLQGTMGNYEQVKVTKCLDWWQSNDGVARLMKADHVGMIVMTVSRSVFFVSEKLELTKVFNLHIAVNFSFSCVAVDAEGSLLAAGSYGDAQSVSRENSKRLAKVDSALSAVVRQGDRAFFGDERGKIVVVNLN